MWPIDVGAFFNESLKGFGPQMCKENYAFDTNLDDYLWIIVTSIEEADISLVKTNLSLYHKKFMNDNDVKSPLVWWKYHEKKSYYCFFCSLVFGIPRFQIEAKHIFSIVNILTNL